MSPKAVSILAEDRERLLSLARQAMNAAGRLQGGLEVYVEHAVTTTVKVYDRKIESVTVGEPSGIGVRFVQDGKHAYAYTSLLSPASIAATVQAAVQGAQAGDDDPYVNLPKPSGSAFESELWAPEIQETTLEDKIALALAAEASAYAEPEVETVEEAVYEDVDRRVAIVSTEGVEVFGAASYAYVYAFVHAGRKGEIRSGLAAMGGRRPRDIDARRVGKDAAARARALLGAHPCASGLYTVVLDRSVVAALIASVGQALSADAVQKGRSVFCGLEGACVGTPMLSLYDDRLHPLGPRSFPFDGEGVARQSSLALIEKGRLSSLLFDSRTAARAGVSSTGNASRSSYRTQPIPAPTNLILWCQGSGGLVEVAARVGTGLFVSDVSGLHSGINLTSGEISLGLTGRLIEGGALTRAVHEVTMATDVVSLLSNVVDAGDDAEWDVIHGGVLCPTLAVQNVAISGF